MLKINGIERELVGSAVPDVQVRHYQAQNVRSTADFLALAPDTWWRKTRPTDRELREQQASVAAVAGATVTK